jgi:peroxisomal 2,4-dienoyl-CoA reductase
MQSSSAESESSFEDCADDSAKGLEQSAAALSKTTGRKCISASADVRNPEQLASAVQKAISEFGHIDHVICGAAGNLYAPPPLHY